MEFKALSQPSVFLASPGDLSQLRMSVLRAFEKLRTEVANDRNIRAYAWESEIEDLGFHQWLPAAHQIPLPSDPLCRAVLCFFSERIGTPMRDSESYRSHLGNAEHNGCNAGHLVLNWKDGAEEEGGFPLTGTVFEVLVTLASNEKAGYPKEGSPPFQIWFIGDEAILHDDPENANWGNGRLYNEITAKRKKRLSDEYFSQVRQLHNFINYLKHRNIPLIEHSIVHTPDEAIEKSRLFLMKHLRYTRKKTTLNPFKGLQFYDVAEEHAFFGRKPWIEVAHSDFERLWSAPNIPFYGIVGGSGAGKSSLLRAGLIARLQDTEAAIRSHCVVVNARDLISPLVEGSHIGLSIQQPLDRLLQSVAMALGSTIYPGTTPEPDEAVETICSLIQTSVESRIHSQRRAERIVIALDQFEEVVDYRASPAYSDALAPLFRFITKACLSGRIGFIYTCQSNRVELLSRDTALAPVIEKGTQKWVVPVDEDTICEIAVRKFEIIGVELSRDLLEHLRRSVEEFTNKATQSAIKEESSKDSQSSLLPLLSLTLLRLSNYCVQKKDELTTLGLKRHHNAPKAESRFTPSLVEPLPEAGNPERNGTYLTSHGILVVALNDLPKDILRIESAISDQAEKVVKETRETPGISWDDDVIAAVLRRLVRIESIQEDRFYLAALQIPRRRGVTRVFVEKMREQRLLIPVGRDHVRLVHQAIIKFWSLAATWLEREKELLGAANQLHSMAAYWDSNNRKPQHLCISSFQVDLIGRLLSNWREVFAPRDGTSPREEDRLLLKFSLAVLAAENTPERAIQDSELSTCHFLIAVQYGENSLVRQYLDVKTTQSVHVRNSKGSNAAFAAASSDDLTTLELVLQAGADATMANLDGWRPIHVAAANGNIQLLTRLIEAGADVHVTGSTGRTCLHLAVANDDITMVRHLIEVCRASPSVLSEESWTPLHAACASGACDAARYLLSIEALDSAEPDNLGWSPFLLACRNADGDTVRELLKRSTTKVVQTVGGWTPLHLAIYRKSLHVVDALLADERIDRVSETPTKKAPIELAIEEWGNEGAAALLRDPYRRIDADATGPGRESQLSLACKAGSVDLVRTLVEGGADVNSMAQPLKLSPFLESAERGDLPILEILLPKANPEKTDRAGRTALHLAALNGHVEAVQAIAAIFEGGWHARRDQEGCTALHLAASQGQLAAVESLLAHIDPRLRDNQGDTALHVATALNYLEIVRAIITKDRNLVECRDELGRMCSHIAARYGNKDLLHKSIDPQFRTREDRQGLLPLHYAARFGKTEIIDLLLDGIDPNVADHFGWTPLHMAAQSGYTETVTKLLEAHASPLPHSSSPLGTPFHVAAEAGQTSVLELLSTSLRAASIDENFWESVLFAATSNAQFETALSVLDIRERGKR